MKKKFTAMSLVMAIVMSVFAFQFGGVEAEAAGKTGVGLAEHALNCYYGGWQYEYGYAGQVVNGVTDCFRFCFRKRLQYSQNPWPRPVDAGTCRRICRRWDGC